MSTANCVQGVHIYFRLASSAPYVIILTYFRKGKAKVQRQWKLPKITKLISGRNKIFSVF